MATNDDPSRNFVSGEIAIRRESLATCLSFCREGVLARKVNDIPEGRNADLRAQEESPFSRLQVLCFPQAARGFFPHRDGSPFCCEQARVAKKIHPQG